MKRTPLVRKAPLKQTADKRQPVSDRLGKPLRARKPIRQISAKARARKAQEALEPGRGAWKAQHRGKCAVCGQSGWLVRHHIVRESEVRRAGADPWDLRNALELGSDECSCHRHHHDAFARIPLAKIPQAAIDFAIEALGTAWAWREFNRFYQPTGGQDERQAKG